MIGSPRIVPLPGYNFTVSIITTVSGNDVPLIGDNYFSKISGISATRNTKALQAGAGNRTTYHLPTEVTYSPLVLERGIVAESSPLTDWCTNSISMSMGGIKTALIKVFLLDPNTLEPSMTWGFYNAYPTKWTISDFDAQDSKYAFESIEFSYSYYSRIY
jgi:phage tail-like protein